MANDMWDSFRLKRLAKEADDYEKWRSFNCPNMADVLNEFPSVHVDPEFLLTQLPLLQPRYYSISSSRAISPEEIHLTMGLVCYRSHEDKGPKKYGVCTSYFDRFPKGEVPCFVRSAPGFRLPAKKSVPVIMVGAGSGIAPFRSFWQQRSAEAQEGVTSPSGKMILFFGCRQQDQDNIFGDELNSLVRSGVIHELFLALSREPGQKKRYVQDQVFIQRTLVHWLLTREEAHIYVCGDALMADGVRKAVKRVIEHESHVTPEEADATVDRLLNEGRYHEDVFGAIHHK
jgi:sulfite reductase alpha subunit-like flavoprotein